MGTENPGGPIRPPSSPFASAPPTMAPFPSSGTLVGSEASNFRPTPPTMTPFSSAGPRPPTMTPFSSAGPRPPAQLNNPSVPSPPIASVLPSGGPYQRFQTTPYTSTVQTTPTHAPPQVPPVPMGSSPQPPSGPLFSGPRPNFQLPFPGYSSQKPAVSQAPFAAQQGSFMPPPPASSPFASQKGGYVPPPPVAAPLSYHSRDQMHHPSSAPPIGGIQSLAEDFSSLSFASMPGSIEPGLNYRTLPRPLDGDVEPFSFNEMYPMNYSPRYLRLTTSAIPSSKSLVSRWHLPLGAVVCPLAEAPEGEEVPVINLTSTGNCSLQKMSYICESLCHFYRCWKKVALQYLRFTK